MHIRRSQGDDEAPPPSQGWIWLTTTKLTLQAATAAGVPHDTFESTDEAFPRCTWTFFLDRTVVLEFNRDGSRRVIATLWGEEKVFRLDTEEMGLNGEQFAELMAFFQMGL